MGPERGVGGRWWIKDGRTEGARGREACGSLPGRCDGRFNLSIPPCPQQLSETEGLKTPRAEAHKSRLGWSKKAEEEEGLEGGDRGDASSQIWSTRPPASPRQSLVPGTPQGAAASSPTTGSAGWRPYSKCHRLVWFAAACTGEPGREYSWPVPPEQLNADRRPSGSRRKHCGGGSRRLALGNLLSDLLPVVRRCVSEQRRLQSDRKSMKDGATNSVLSINLLREIF